MDHVVKQESRYDGCSGSGHVHCDDDDDLVVVDETNVKKKQQQQDDDDNNNNKKDNDNDDDPKEDEHYDHHDDDTDDRDPKHLKLYENRMNQMNDMNQFMLYHNNNHDHHNELFVVPSSSSSQTGLQSQKVPTNQYQTNQTLNRSFLLLQMKEMKGLQRNLVASYKDLMVDHHHHHHPFFMDKEIERQRSSSSTSSATSLLSLLELVPNNNSNTNTNTNTNINTRMTITTNSTTTNTLIKDHDNHNKDHENHMEHNNNNNKIETTTTTTSTITPTTTTTTFQTRRQMILLSRQQQQKQQQVGGTRHILSVHLPRSPPGKLQLLSSSSSSSSASSSSSTSSTTSSSNVRLESQKHQQQSTMTNSNHNSNNNNNNMGSHNPTIQQKPNNTNHHNHIHNHKTFEEFIIKTIERLKRRTKRKILQNKQQQTKHSSSSSSSSLSYSSLKLLFTCTDKIHQDYIHCIEQYRLLVRLQQNEQQQLDDGQQQEYEQQVQVQSSSYNNHSSCSNSYQVLVASETTTTKTTISNHNHHDNHDDRNDDDGIYQDQPDHNQRMDGHLYACSCIVQQFLNLVPLLIITNKIYSSSVSSSSTHHHHDDDDTTSPAETQPIPISPQKVDHGTNHHHHHVNNNNNNNNNNNININNKNNCNEIHTTTSTSQKKEVEDVQNEEKGNKVVIGPLDIVYREMESYLLDQFTTLLQTQSQPQQKQNTCNTIVSPRNAAQLLCWYEHYIHLMDHEVNNHNHDTGNNSTTPTTIMKRTDQGSNKKEESTTKTKKVSFSFQRKKQATTKKIQISPIWMKQINECLTIYLEKGVRHEMTEWIQRMDRNLYLFRHSTSPNHVDIDEMDIENNILRRNVQTGEIITIIPNEMMYLIDLQIQVASEHLQKDDHILSVLYICYEVILNWIHTKRNQIKENWMMNIKIEAEEAEEEKKTIMKKNQQNHLYPLYHLFPSTSKDADEYHGNKRTNKDDRVCGVASNNSKQEEPTPTTSSSSQNTTTTRLSIVRYCSIINDAIHLSDLVEKYHHKIMAKYDKNHKKKDEEMIQQQQQQQQQQQRRRRENYEEDCDDNDENDNDENDNDDTTNNMVVVTKLETIVATIEREFVELSLLATDYLCQQMMYQLEYPEPIMNCIGSPYHFTNHNNPDDDDHTDHCSVVELMIQYLQEDLMDLEIWIGSEYFFAKVCKQIFQHTLQMYVTSFYKNTMKYGIQQQQQHTGNKNHHHSKMVANILKDDYYRLTDFFTNTTLFEKHGMYSKIEMNEQLVIILSMSRVLDPEWSPSDLFDDVRTILLHCCIMTTTTTTTTTTSTTGSCGDDDKDDGGYGNGGVVDVNDNHNNDMYRCTVVLHLAGLREKQNRNDSIQWVRAITIAAQEAEEEESKKHPNNTKKKNNSNNTFFIQLPADLCNSPYIYRINLNHVNLERHFTTSTPSHRIQYKYAKEIKDLLETGYKKQMQIYLLIRQQQQQQQQQQQNNKNHDTMKKPSSSSTTTTTAVTSATVTQKMGDYTEKIGGIITKSVDVVFRNRK